MQKNKDHWYDGWFYDTFIAPNQDKMFYEIKNLIEPNAKILDVGCGTGRFSFFIADKCNSVTGIDLSQRNIKKAEANLRIKPNDKISFRHGDVSDIIGQNVRYDYAVLTYVIHEVDENERAPLIKSISSLADKIIIGDYLVPRHKGFWNLLNELVEFAAGKEHYKNFKNFVRKGGLTNLAVETSFRILKEIINKPTTSHLIMLTKR